MLSHRDVHTKPLSDHTPIFPALGTSLIFPATTGLILDPALPVYGNFIVDPKCDSVRHAMEIRVLMICEVSLRQSTWLPLMANPQELTHMTDNNVADIAFENIQTCWSGYQDDPSEPVAFSTLSLIMRVIMQRV
jgi:hypothetical protein